MADYKDQDLSTPEIDLRVFSTPEDFVNSTDLATWDAAVVCGSCHIGGSIVEFDRNGVRHAQRDMVAGYTADQNYVDEMFNAAGLPTHLENGVEVDGFAPAYAPWAYPAVMGGNPVMPAMLNTADDAMPGVGLGWATGNEPGAVAGQMLMPNVREMDCFFCHLEGFNNIISSVAVQMGYLNAAPSMAAGMLNMFSQTYMPNVWQANPNIPVDAAFGTPAMLSGSMLSRLQGEPLAENCRQCHTPTTMENFSSMFDEFLAAAPMTYDPLAPGASPINGMVMPAYDLNAQFEMPTSREVVFNYSTYQFEYTDGTSAAGPFGLFPMAMDTSWSMLAGDTAVGGGKPMQTGPLYYANGELATGGYAAMSTQTGFAPGMSNQNTWKKSTIPFPRADFFKRGDIWDDKNQEVHYNFGCAGCHYNTNTGNNDLNQCDPGRGRTRMGGVESGALLNGGTLADAVPAAGITAQQGPALPQSETAIDTHDTVKSCQECHITGKNVYGLAIETFGAPNPTGAHADAGLLATVTTARALDASGNEIDITGTHMDVMDCSVCHVYKKSMTVRALDSTSGNRYPTIEGIQNNKGMMAMFTDPFTEADLTDAQALQWFEMFMSGMGYTGGMNIGNESGAIEMMYGYMQSTYGMDAVTFARSQLHMDPVEWTPIFGWHANTPKYLPLAGGIKGTATNGAAVNPNWRRKLVPINFIVAQMWDDVNGAEDQNGDNAEARGLDGIKWDPPISRDMKVGMNFAPGPFATIPVGFGGGAYQSAYDMADMSFTGDFQFVGVYGGNIMLTTPGEIAGYKAYRNSIMDASVPGRSKDWTNTELVFQGGNPFQVTHNIVNTEKHALGKKVDGAYGCNDCHAADAGFFDGDYDMTGTAVPASATYQVIDPMGLPTTEIPSTMMYRPVVDYEVVALATDLRTGSEAKSKTTGAVLDVEFDVLGCFNGDETSNGTYVNGFIEAVGVHDVASVDCSAYTDTRVYKRTIDLSRAEFMYPDLDHAALTAKLASLESITPEAVGIGVTPAASAMSVGGATSTGGTAAIKVAQDVALALAPAGATPTSGTVSYSYYNINDDAVTDVPGSSVTFTAPGVYRVVMTSTTVEGKVAQSYQYVVVEAPARGAEDMAFVVTGNDVELTLTNIPADAVKARIKWSADENYQYYSSIPVDGVFNKTYTAAPAGEVVNVIFYNAANLNIDAWSDTVQ